MTQEKKAYKKGRIAFRSVEEKIAFDLTELVLPAFRHRLYDVKRIQVLRIALARLEGRPLAALSAKTKMRLLRQSLARLGAPVSVKYPEHKPNASVMHERTA